MVDSSRRISERRCMSRAYRIGSEAARPREGPPYDVSFNRRRRNAPSRLLSRVPRFPQVPCRFSGSTKDLLQVGSWASPTLEAFDVTRAGEVGHGNWVCNASLLKKKPQASVTHLSLPGRCRCSLARCVSLPLSLQDVATALLSMSVRFCARSVPGGRPDLLVCLVCDTQRTTHRRLDASWRDLFCWRATKCDGTTSNVNVD